MSVLPWRTNLPKNSKSKRYIWVFIVLGIYRMVRHWYGLYAFCVFRPFWAYVGQPDDHIGWATLMPFALICFINPRTNLWNFHEKILIIGGVEKLSFFESAILIFFSKRNKKNLLHPHALWCNLKLQTRQFCYTYFAQPTDLKEFLVLFYLLKCELHFSGDVSQPQVLIAVQSGPKNKGLRSEVRRTWGGACKTVHQSWCSVIFVLGKLLLWTKYFSKGYWQQNCLNIGI